MSGILYLDDWKKYPNAIVHTSTKNKSFIRLAALYRDMGIKNHTFILALFNPALEFIDPFDPNLTLDETAMVAAECKQNFFTLFGRSLGLLEKPVVLPCLFERIVGTLRFTGCFLTTS